MLEECDLSKVNLLEEMLLAQEALQSHNSSTMVPYKNPRACDMNAPGKHSLYQNHREHLDQNTYNPLVPCADHIIWETLHTLQLVISLCLKQKHTS